MTPEYSATTIIPEKAAKPQRRGIVNKKKKTTILEFGHFEQARLKALAEFDDL
jgi:hypothetical protein